MVKTIISIACVMVIIIAGAMYEDYYVHKQFDDFKVVLTVLYEKVDNETALMDDVYAVQKNWLKKKKNLQDNYRILRKMTIAANKAGKVTIEVKGIENLPKEDGFVMFPNHQGLYDCLAFIESCPRALSFVIKKEAKEF